MLLPAALSIRADEPDRTAIALEALSRLKGVDLKTNAPVREAVTRLLEKTRGTASFVRLVRDFHIEGHDGELLKIAINNPSDEGGVEAMRLLLAGKDLDLVRRSLDNTNRNFAEKTAEALGNSASKESVALLLPLVTDTNRGVALRKQAVRSLAQTRDGATALLNLAREDNLPADLKLTASMALNQVSFPRLKADAAQLLPLPQSKNAQPLPPISELLKMSGDPKRGAEVFAREEVTCTKCHRVNDKGGDVGPALSEIGTKLGRDALYETILDPSAGISTGFEAWSIEQKSGDELLGIITSETVDEIVMKDIRNIPIHVKKGDITRRAQSKLSLMPAGLQQTMSTQDLADLVEFLASLKKAD